MNDHLRRHFPPADLFLEDANNMVDRVSYDPRYISTCIVGQVGLFHGVFGADRFTLGEGTNLIHPETSMCMDAIDDRIEICTLVAEHYSKDPRFVDFILDVYDYIPYEDEKVYAENREDVEVNTGYLESAFTKVARLARKAKPATNELSGQFNLFPY